MKKINWGVLGTSGFAYNIAIPAMKESAQCNLYAVAGRSLSKAQLFKDTFNFEKAYSSYDEMLDDKNVTSVYIPLANNVHKEWVIKAANKGKHILCEKPMAGNFAELTQMLECCKKNNVIIMEAYAYLHSEITNHIKSTIKSGVIGDVTFMESSFFTPFPKPPNHRIEKSGNGGSVYDLGCYPISLFLNITEKSPINVMAHAHFTSKGIDDYANAYMEFDGGIKAGISCGMCSSSENSRYFIYGTNGYIDAPIHFNSKGDLAYYIVKDNKKKEVRVQTSNNYILEFDQFNRCILNNEKPFVSNDFSKMVAGTIDSVLNAMGYNAI